MLNAEIQNFYSKSALNFTNYWIEFLNANSNYDSLSKERENIFLAFQKAIQFDILKMALRAHTLFEFFEKQGQYIRLQQILKYIDNKSENIDAPETIVKNYEYMGKVELRLENFDTARSHFLSGLVFAKNNNLEQLAGTIEYELAQVEFETHHYEVAVQYLESALEKAQKYPDKFHYISILSSLAKIAYFQGHFEVGIEYCLAGLPISKKNQFHSISASFLTYLGVIKYAQADLSASRAYMIDGLHYGRLSEEIFRINNLLTNLGSLETEIGNLTEAQKYLEEALTLSKRMGNTGFIAHILMDLGLLKYQIGEEEQGMIYVNESVELAREFDDWSLLMHVLKKRADLYFQNEWFEFASMEYEAMLTIEVQFNNRVKQTFASAHWRLTLTYEQLDNKSKAIFHAKKSLSLYKSIDSSERELVEAWLEKNAPS